MEQLLSCLSALLSRPIRIRSFVFLAFPDFQICPTMRLLHVSHTFEGLLGTTCSPRVKCFLPKSGGHTIANDSAVEKKTDPAGCVIGWKMGSRDWEE